MAAAPEVSHGATVVFGTSSSFTPKVLGITIEGETRPVVDVTHFGVTGYREMIPGKLVTANPVTVRYLWEENVPPITAVPETITITFPDTGDVAGTGFVSAFSVNVDTGDDGAMEAEFTITWDGKTGPTWTPSV